MHDIFNQVGINAASLIATDPNSAKEFYRRLVVKINEFHRGLDDNFEVGARLVSFGQNLTFHIEDIGYWNPSLVTFYGRNELGEPVELIQHVTQISVLLVAMKRENAEQPKRPIGFANWDEYNEKIKE